MRTTRLDDRLERILFLLNKRGRLSTLELSRIFQVSEVTIRNDLKKLSRRGLAIRSYGGAVIASPPAESAATRSDHGLLEGGESVLEELGALAAASIQDGDVIYIDSSFQSESFLRLLGAKRHLTVLTNSIALAHRLGSLRQLSVYLVGGRIDADTLTVMVDEGNIVDRLGGGHNLTRAFMGALGLTREEGFTDSRPESVPLRRNVLRLARKRTIVIDSSRWGNVSLCSFAKAGDVDVVVTDEKAPEPMLACLREWNIEVQQPKKDHRAGRVSRLYRRYQELREQATLGRPYPGRPGAGRRIAFANGFADEPFCQSLAEGFVEQALLAGFSRKNIFLFDNRYDSETALANMEKVLELRPDIFVQFQVYAQANSIIAGRFEQAGIPILALEVPVPTAAYVGVNNWQAGILAGELAARILRSKPGGFARLDRVVLIGMATGGEINLLRTEGFAAALAETFGGEVEEKIVREPSANNTAAGARAAMDRVLADFPRARHLAVTTVNHECMAGVIEALQAVDRWDPERLVLVAHGCDLTGRRQLREGLVDGSVAYFPEKYGQFILPAACSILESEPLPPQIYVDIQPVTREDLPVLYPQE